MGNLTLKEFKKFHYLEEVLKLLCQNFNSKKLQKVLFLHEWSCGKAQGLKTLQNSPRGHSKVK